MAGTAKIFIIFCLLVSLTAAEELQTEQIFEKIIQSLADETLRNLDDIGKTSGILVTDEGPAETFSDFMSNQKNEYPKNWITEAYSELGIPNFLVKGSHVKILPKDLIKSGSSVAITSWIVPQGIGNKTTIRQRLHEIDEMTSALGKNTIIVLDRHGKVWEMIDSFTGRVDTKGRLNRKIIMAHSNKFGHNFISIVCPYQQLSRKSIMLRTIQDVSRSVGTSCPPPLKGAWARISTIGSTPYILSRPMMDPANPTRKIRVSEKDPVTGNLLGVDNDIANLLCQSLRCDSYTLRVTEGNMFDHYSAKDNKWKGRTGELLEGKVDFALGFSAAPRQAYMKLSITGYCYFNEVSFTTGHPKYVTSLFNVIKPFNSLIWSLAGVVVIIMTFMFVFIYWFHQRLGVHATRQLSYWEIPLQTLESMFEFRMLTFFAPTIPSAKVLRFCFIIFIAFFVMFYNSNLRANLMAKETDRPIDTVEDLVERGLTLYVPQGSPPAQFIMRQRDKYPYNSLKVQLYGYKNGATVSMDKYERTSAVADTRILNLYGRYPDYPKDRLIYHFGKVWYTKYSHIMMKQGSPIAETLTNTLSRLHAMAFPDHFIWMRLPIEAKDWDPNAGLNDNEAINLQQMFLAFVIWLVTISASIVAFLCERRFPNNWILTP